jgi:hypothetical protein
MYKMDNKNLSSLVKNVGIRLASRNLRHLSLLTVDCETRNCYSATLERAAKPFVEILVYSGKNKLCLMVY